MKNPFIRGRKKKMETNLTWYENKIGYPKTPKWIRTIAVADDGKIFIPAAIYGDEKVAFLCASFDGVAHIINDEHLYLPLDWVENESSDPRVKNICATIKNKHANEVKI